MNGMNDFEKELAKDIRQIREHTGKLREDVAGLKVRSGFMGVIGGTIAAAVAMTIQWFKVGSK